MARARSLGNGRELADGIDRRHAWRDRAAAPPVSGRLGGRVGAGLRAGEDLDGAARFVAVRGRRGARGGAGALFVGAFGRFRRAGTAVEPWRPSTALVTGGVYRFTRNPIYLGMALLYFGLALAVDSAVTLALLLPLLALVQVGVVSREERYLEAKFGDDYRRYRAAVRRWI